MTLQHQTHSVRSNHDREAMTTGLLLMVGAMLIIPAMDICAKLLSDTLNGVQIAQARFGFQFVFLAPIALWRAGLKGILPNNIPLNLIRSVLMALAVMFFFTALKWMPVPDAIAVFFAEPLILTLLSAIFLKEQVGWRRVTAIVIGFIGALIVIRPSYSVFGPVSLLPLATASCFAVYLMLTSKLSKSEDALTMQVFSGLIGFVVLSAIVFVADQGQVEILAFHWPSLSQWGLLMVIGLIATGCHLMIVHAFRHAPASVLAPFNYIEIVSATILSYLVFDQIPDAIRWLGIAIIVGSGLYVYWRERQVG